MKAMGETTTSVAGGFRRGLAALVAYEVLFKLLAAAALGPLSAWVLARLIAVTGSVAVSNEHILSFVLSPWGVLTLLVGGVLTFVITLIEQAGLMELAWASLSERRLPATAALWRAFRRGRRLLRLAGCQIGLFTAVSLPFAAVIGAAYVTWLGDHDINFYLATRPAKFWWAAGVGGTAAVGLAVTWALLYLRLMFALPACALAEQPAWESIRESFRRTRGRFARHAAALLAWLAAVSLVGGLLGWGVDLVDGLAIHCAGERLGFLLPALAAAVLLNLLVATVVSFVGVTTNALVVCQLYRTAGGQGGDPSAASAEVDARSTGLPEWLTIRRAIVAGTLLFAAGTALITRVLVEQIGIEDNVKITAHRGASLVAPENSMAAVKEAIRQEADYIEFDIQELGDGTIAVLHDKDLKRVTGLAKNVWEVSYDDIRTLDSGSWFSPEFADQRIPTLQDVVDAAKGHVRLNIELKFHGHERRFVETVVGIIAANRFHDHCVVTSLDYQGLMRAKKLDDRLTVGHIVTVALGDTTVSDADFLSVHQDKATTALINTLHRAGKQIHVWTVNDAARMSRLIDLGVDNLITDDPALARRVLEERQGMSTAERLLLGVRHWLGK